MTLNSGIQTNHDNVCIPRLSGILLAVDHLGHNVIRMKILIQLQELFILDRYFILYSTLATNSMAKVNLNKSKFFLTSATTASKYILKRTRICINWNLKSHLSDPNLLSKSTSKCKHCETRFSLWKTVFENFMNLGLKGGISIDADSGQQKSRRIYFYSDCLWPYCEQEMFFQLCFNL